MKYLCLGYYEPDQFEKLTSAEQAAIGDACRPHDERLYATGKVSVVASLGEGTKVIRTRGGRKKVTDGPYVETKEMVGSFFVVEAKDEDEAVRIASLHPAANWGEQVGMAIEVRPIDFYVENPTPGGS